MGVRGVRVFASRHCLRRPARLCSCMGRESREALPRLVPKPEVPPVCAGHSVIQPNLVERLFPRWDASGGAASGCTSGRPHRAHERGAACKSLLWDENGLHPTQTKDSSVDWIVPMGCG